jgi:hypothetical protein
LNHAQLANIAAVTGENYADVLKVAQTEYETAEVWNNHFFRAVVRRYPVEAGVAVVHLSVIHNKLGSKIFWDDLQRVKNELVGPECEAVELFPAESRKVDVGDMRHLWCTTDTSYRYPLGFMARDGEAAELKKLFANNLTPS